MEFISKEINTASSVPASLTDVDEPTVSYNDLKNTIASYIGNLDYRLLSHYNQGQSLSSPGASSKDVALSTIRSIRLYMINSISRTDPDYNNKITVANKTFELVEKAIDLLDLSTDRQSKIPLAVLLLGSVTKQLT